MLWKTNTLTINALPSLSVSFYCCAWCYKVWMSPLSTLGQLSSPCPIPATCPDPAYWPLQDEEGWRDNHGAVQALFNSIQNTGMLPKMLATNTKQNTTRSSWRKLAPSHPDPIQMPKTIFTWTWYSPSEKHSGF